MTRHPQRVFHPSEMIDEEMQARGWGIPEIAMAMVSEGSADPLIEYSANYLAVELYFSAGPTNKACRMGPEFIAGISRAFGTSADFWENLERRWIEAWPSDEPEGNKS